MGGLYVATTLHARTACKINAMLSSADAVRAKPHMLFATEEGALPDDTLAEWLRRRPAKPMGSPCVGSNPTGVVFVATSTRCSSSAGPRGPRSRLDARRESEVEVPRRSPAQQRVDATSVRSTARSLRGVDHQSPAARGLTACRSTLAE